MPSNPLVEAINLLRTGDSAGARNLVIPIIKADPHNEKAWLILAETLPTNREKIATLDRFLQIAPHSELAQRRLQALQQAAAAPQPPASIPQQAPPPAAQEPPIESPSLPVAETPPPAAPNLDAEAAIEVMRAAETSKETFEWGAVAESGPSSADAAGFGDLRAAADTAHDLEDESEDLLGWDVPAEEEADNLMRRFDKDAAEP
jgi:hypothetical protein